VYLMSARPEELNGDNHNIYKVCIMLQGLLEWLSSLKGEVSWL